MLDLLNVDCQLILHAAKVTVELVRQLVHTLNTIALLLLNLTRTRERRPDANYFRLLQAEEILVQHTNLGVDSRYEALDVEHLIR